MGQGHEKRGWPAEWLGGDIYATEDVSEQNQRAFFDCWARYLDTPPNAQSARKNFEAAE